MCETLDSMIECLESLYNVEKMREIMIELASNEAMEDIIKEMSSNGVKINFAIDLLIHWTDSMGADPLEVLSKIALRWSSREKAHAEQE